MIVGKILTICEKKDQAEKLAAAMGWQKGSFCFTGTLNGKQVELVWASGHLHELLPPNEIDKTLKWTDQPTKLIPIPRDFRLRLIQNDNLPPPIQAKTLFANITKRLKYVDEIIIATDADREGEAIGRNIIKESNFQGTVRRAWLAGGLDKKSLTSAMANLKGPYETIGWYRASQARGFSDWAYQYLVRAYTFYAKYGKFGHYLGQGNGSEGVMSVGRLQTVIVSMIVKRDEEIENFVAKDHFTISGLFNFQSENFSASFSPKVTEAIISDAPKGVTFEPQKPKGDTVPLDKPLYTDKATVEEFKERLISVADKATVSKYVESTSKESPPNAYALTDAQKEIGKLCGTNASLTQVILEDLYEQGWTSYARTSKSELPMNLYDPVERNSVLGHLVNLPQVGQQAQFVMDLHNGKDPNNKPFKPKVFVSKDMEHYGIIPTQQSMSPQAFANLSPKKKSKSNKVMHTAQHMQIAYEAIAKRYIQALYPPAEYATQSVELFLPVKDILGNEKSVFKANGKRIVEEGWKKAFPKRGGSKDTVLPKMSDGEVGLLKQIDTKKSRTKAPPRYNTVSLPKELELVGKEVSDPKLRKRLQNAEGIGRPATRSTAIETIQVRGYAETKKEEFYSTRKGRDLIKFVPNWLSTPEMSAVWEDYITKIESEKDDATATEMRDKFVAMQMEKIEKLIDYMNNKFLADLGERVRQAPKQVSEKMKKAIKNIEQRKDIKAPRGTLSDPMMAKAFLDEHLSASNTGIYPPSEKQKALIEKIAKNVAKDEFPADMTMDDIMKDSKKASAFIDKFKNRMPPTQGQLNFLDKIIASLPAGTKIPDDVRTSAKSCSAFIDKHKKQKA